MSSHTDTETQKPRAASTSSQGGSHASTETHSGRAATCDLLRRLHRQRQGFHRAEKSLTLQIKAMCRWLVGGDLKDANALYKSIGNGEAHELTAEATVITTPFFEARAVLQKRRKSVEKEMTKLAKTLPVYPWVESVRGFGVLGFAQIIGECGDLNNYATVSKLWKRCGLAVIKGERQQRKPGAAALEHGYSPPRRAVLWNVGESLFKAGGEYADIARARKEVEVQKAEAEGLTVLPAAKIPSKDKEAYRSQGHVHNRAVRYMTKRLLQNLWAAWRKYQ